MMRISVTCSRERASQYKESNKMAIVTRGRYGRTDMIIRRTYDLNIFRYSSPEYLQENSNLQYSILQYIMLYTHYIKESQTLSWIGECIPLNSFRAPANSSMPSCMMLKHYQPQRSPSMTLFILCPGTAARAAPVPPPQSTLVKFVSKYFPAALQSISLEHHSLSC